MAGLLVLLLAVLLACTLTPTTAVKTVNESVETRDAVLAMEFDHSRLPVEKSAPKTSEVITATFSASINAGVRKPPLNSGVNATQQNNE